MCVLRMTLSGELYALMMHDGKLFQEMIDRMPTTVRQFRCAVFGDGVITLWLRVCSPVERLRR
jgi:hypothetical protein